MSQEFKKGDVVKLKSGGPLMTVANVGEHYGESKVWCVWFEKTKKFEDVFDPATLAKSGGARSISISRA